MDKRTIIFVFLVSVTFFGLNFFFSCQRDEKNRRFLKNQESTATHKRQEKQAEIENRTAKLHQLPMVQIYLNPEINYPTAYGINIHGNTLTLAWDHNLPDLIFVNHQPQVLLTENVVKGGVVIYGEKHVNHLDIYSLPDTGIFDLQIVTFPINDPPHVHFGNLKDGELIIPSGSIDQNGVALYHSPVGWFPIGFYDWKANILIELQHLPNLTDILNPLTIDSNRKNTQEEKIYVLENAYQQIVFSNIGGAIVEINLPFQSEKNPDSVIKEIGFDREILDHHPSHAHFPLAPYYTSDDTTPHLSGKLGGYYPLLRRNLSDKRNLSMSPQYYALNLVSDYPEIAELVYEVIEFTPTKIVFEANQPQRKITKTYTLNPDNSGPPYIFYLSLRIDGDSRRLWLTSGVPEVEIMSNSSSPQIQYYLNSQGKKEVKKLSLPKVKEVINVGSIHPDWIVNSNGYLGIIMDPLNEMSSGYRATAIPGSLVPTRLSLIDPNYKPYPASKYPGYQTLLPIPTTGGTLNFRIYAGAFEEAVLKKIDTYYSDSLGDDPNYIASRTFYGWFSFISEPFAKLLFIVMKFFHHLTCSWGFSIILLTIFLRILLYPLNAWSIKSMRRMQLLSPQIQNLQKKYKKEPKKAQIEIMSLYREKHVNPFTGCIPILIQIPFLIAMFDLLKSSFQLRGAVFIPGWINDLTAPDVLFQWKTPIFFIGNQFHLLPLLLGLVMFLQQKLTSTTPKDPAQMTDQQKQQKTMGTIMTIVFMVMFYHFPSGLNLYWLSSMLLGIGQTLMTNRLLDKKNQHVQQPILQKKKNSLK
ncbi:MAG: membrane protein insertase YidC [Chlamydiales bacterium]